MKNLRMKEKLDSGEAIDLSGCPRTADGDYIFKDFIEGKDYCDAKLEQWIWSIGRPNEKMVVKIRPEIPGVELAAIILPTQFLASTTAKLYLNQDFECVWLR